MRGKLKHLPRPVVRTLLSFYLRTRFYELLRALLAPLLCYAVLALLATHLDRFLFLDTPGRLWISAVTHGVCLLVGMISLGLFAWRQRSVSRLAYELERRLPQAAAERLVTLDDILARETGDAKTGGSVHDALVEQLTQETVKLCQATPSAGRFASDRRLARRTVLLVLLALVWGGLLAATSYQFPLMLERLTFPQRNLPKPSFMRLAVTPEAAVIGRGGEVVLQVQVSGAIPQLLQSPMRWLGVDPSRCLLSMATGQVTRLPMGPEARPMSRVQSRLFVASRSDLQESFSYRVRCGDAQTDIRLVRVVVQPRVLNAVVLVDPPAYTGLKTVRFEDFRDSIPAFADSHVKLRFAADQAPLKAARLVGLRDGNIVAELKPDPQTGTYLYEFKMENPVEMEIVLVNELGFENVERICLSMALREDQAPTVRLEYPGGEISAVQGELVPMHIEMVDDLGLLEGAICYQVNAGRNPDGTMREIVLPVEAGTLTQSLAASLDLAKVDAVPGDEVLLWVRVRDTGRKDERSQAVRIQITAFAGNENERRRLAALRLVGQILTIVEPSAANRTALALNEAAYEPITTDAKNQGLVLSDRAVPESLLTFIEREHFFTDSAEAATELLLLYGVIDGQLHLPPTPSPHSIDARKAVLRRLADDTLPCFIRERTGRDLIRRALSLRTEIQATMGAADTAERKNRAAQDRRVDLMMSALDDTGADMAALARMSPQMLKLDEVLAFTRQISRVGRDLKHAEVTRQQAAGKALCEQIDGWIGLLLPPLSEWKTQRVAARVALRAQYEAMSQLMGSAWLKAGSQVPPATITSWLAANARMVERTPFAGLGERMASVSPGLKVDSAANNATNAALVCEASVMARMAVVHDFAGWLAAPRLTPSARRLANALQALDLADNQAARAAAADVLKTMSLDDESLADAEPQASSPLTRGLYGYLSLLTDNATNQGESYENSIKALSERTENLLGALTQFNDAETDAVRAFASAIGKLESGLVQWEADAQRLIYRMHLDLTYGDPRREVATRIAATLPMLRESLSRYQVVVPPLLNQLRSRAQKSAKEENLSAMTLDTEELVRCVNALGSKLKLAVKQLRGEAQAQERESESVRELRLYYLAARQLAETNNPAAVAEAFFARNPAAAALVLDSRMPLLRELRDQIQLATTTLQTQTVASAVYYGAMQQATQCVAGFEQQLIRFAALDADGVVRAKAAEIRKHAEALITPGRDAGSGTRAADRMALDGLKRQAAQLENQASELIAKYRVASPRGWFGGPAGVWDGASRRDAESARRRTLAQFDRARREIILGLDAALAPRGTALPDEPLASAIFAWRMLHSSLGGGTRIGIPPPQTDTKYDSMSIYVQKELDIAKKVLRQNETGVPPPYHDSTKNWVESMGGALRR